MRTAQINRTTTETDIKLSLNLDGCGKAKISSGVGFLDHMLNLFARHGSIDLELNCVGDTFVDFHHTTEDIGIALGQAIAAAAGNKAGINRYGSAILPMDEALIMTAIDFSGRGGCFCELNIPAQKVGDFDTELVKEFFIAVAQNAGLTLHIRLMAGENSHHIIEGAFKSFARSLRSAVAIDADHANDVPSTKGVL